MGEVPLYSPTSRSRKTARPEESARVHFDGQIGPHFDDQIGTRPDQKQSRPASKQSPG